MGSTKTLLVDEVDWSRLFHAYGVEPIDSGELGERERIPRQELNVSDHRERGVKLGQHGGVPPVDRSLHPIATPFRHIASVGRGYSDIPYEPQASRRR